MTARRAWLWNVVATGVAMALALTMWRGWVGLIYLFTGYWLVLLPGTLIHTWVLARRPSTDPWSGRWRSIVLAPATLGPMWLVVVWPLGDAGVDGAFNQVAVGLAIALIYGAIARHPAGAPEPAGAAT